MHRPDSRHAGSAFGGRTRSLASTHRLVLPSMHPRLFLAAVRSAIRAVSDSQLSLVPHSALKPLTAR